MEDEGGQKRTSGGLQSVLARKGDEHAFSLLYLIAGVFCLYAAYGHGDGFCTDHAEAAAGGWMGGILADVDGGRSGSAARLQPGDAVAALDPAAMNEMKNRSLSHSGIRALLGAGGAEVWHSDPRLAATEPAGSKAAFLFLAERPLPPRKASVGGDLASAMSAFGVDSLLLRGDKNQSAPATAGGDAWAGRQTAGGRWWPWGGAKDETVAQSLADGGRAETAAPSGSAHEAWAGRHGWVVLWLRVEGFAALFLPLVSIVMLSVGLQDSLMLHATLYMVALFQALCLGVGCVWSFGGFVPSACTEGKVGDPFAYQAMWWVCAVWLGAIVSFSTFTCCILCCFVGAFVRKQESIRSQHADDYA
jgi:hypothetical protein